MALTYIKSSGLDPTSTYTFGNVSLSGDIIPTSNNTVSLGDPTHVFKDVYIGPGSLYIDGSKVLEASGSDIVVTADINQNLRVVTSGSGDVELDPTGTGVVAIKGPLQIEVGTQITSSDGNSIAYADPIAVDALGSLTANTDLTLTGNGTGIVKVDDDLTVTGNITIQGSGGNLSVSTLTVQDNIIDISAETTGAPSLNAGIRVIRGDDPAVQLRWYETDDVWQYTTDGTNYLTIVGKDSAGNVSVGNLSATGLSGTLSTAAQPNITSVGTLSSLTVSGLVTATAGGVKVGNIQDTGGTNTIALSSGSISVTGNITAGASGSGNVTATYFIGNGSQLTSVAASTATTAETVTTAAQTNITSLGTLTGLSVAGNTSFTVGFVNFQATQDKTLSSSPSGLKTFDLTDAAVFDVSPSASWSIDVNSVPTTTNRATVVTFIITQGATGYLPTDFKIGGVSQTVKWINSVAPTASNSKTDVLAYTMVRSSGGSWTVLGQAASYG